MKKVIKKHFYTIDTFHIQHQTMSINFHHVQLFIYACRWLTVLQYNSRRRTTTAEQKRNSYRGQDVPFPFMFYSVVQTLLRSASKKNCCCCWCALPLSGTIPFP